jgi:hypothetical protein
VLLPTVVELAACILTHCDDNSVPCGGVVTRQGARVRTKRTARE